MNNVQEASRVANEYGFEYGDVLKLLNVGVDEKRIIRALHKKQRKEQVEARKAAKKLKLYALSSSRENEYRAIAKEYGVYNSRDYVMRNAIPIKAARIEVRHEWKMTSVWGVDNPVRCGTWAILGGITYLAVYEKLHDPSIAWPWYLWSAPIFLLLLICNLLFRYYCWTPKWYFSLRLKVGQAKKNVLANAADKLQAIKDGHEAKKQTLEIQHRRAAKKYYWDSDYSNQRRAEDLAKNAICLRGALAGMIVGAIAYWVISSIIPNKRVMFFGCVLFAAIGWLVHDFFCICRLKRDEKYFEKFVIKLRKKDAIKEVVNPQPDYVDDMFKTWGFDDINIDP